MAVLKAFCALVLALTAVFQQADCRHFRRDDDLTDEQRCDMIMEAAAGMTSQPFTVNIPTRERICQFAAVRSLADLARLFGAPIEVVGASYRQWVNNVRDTMQEESEVLDDTFREDLQAYYSILDRLGFFELE